MIKSMKSSSVWASAAAAIALVMSQTTVWAASDNAKYDPGTKQVAGTTAGVIAAQYDLKLTAPGSLNKEGMKDLNDGGIPIEITASVLVPSGANPQTALSWLSVSENLWTCLALSEEKTIIVGVNVPAGAPVGDYVFTIAGTPPTGEGWGVGGHILTVSVGEAPTPNPDDVESFVLDTTEPTVNITQPSQTSFIFCIGGTPVEVAFDATEVESPVTATTASVGNVPISLTPTGLGTATASATGAFTLGAIGSYTVTATAENTRALPPGNPDHLPAHLSGSDSVDITVNYDMSNCWLPPLSLGKVSKGGSTIPIKFTARDCNGLFVNDPSVQVQVNEVICDSILGNRDVLVGSASFGVGSTAVRIDQTDAYTGQYIANFQTASGEHKYRVDVFFNGFKQASKQFCVSAK